jgi:putative endonuclease
MPDAAAPPPSATPATTPEWPPQDQWCLYLIECANGAWYAGITNHLERRYAAHASGRGARYTRANPPRHLVGWRAYPDRSSASRAEAAIRKLARRDKLRFLQEATD